jgi:hypothetical protein
VAGPVGPTGLTGAQGIAGLNVPAGTIIWLASGTPAPAGYDLLGTTTQAILRAGQRQPQHTLFDVYRKN